MKGLEKSMFGKVLSHELGRVYLLMVPDVIVWTNKALKIFDSTSKEFFQK